MKTQLAKVAATLALLVSASNAFATVSTDMQSLGSNAESVKRANRLESRSRIAIVQNRSVDRHWRLEVTPTVGAVALGDSYVNTQHAGVNVDLHIMPKVSLGVRYEKAFNQLTQEGKQQFDNARAAYNAGNMNYKVPQIDYADYSVIGTVNWYMIYGKINFFDISVVQFDIYSLAGAGTMQLASGPTTTYTAGAGIGFWFSQHITSRIELRYQNYSDQVYTGSRNLNLMVANFGLGVLL